MIGKIHVVTCRYIGNDHQKGDELLQRLFAELEAGTAQRRELSPPARNPPGETEYVLTTGERIKSDTYILDEGGTFTEYWYVPPFAQGVTEFRPLDEIQINP